MDITYLGHSSFKFRGKTGTLVADPYLPTVGFKMPKVSADIVSVSHAHDDHDAANLVQGTARRQQPFIIDAPGEYELLEISILGFPSFHDDQQGQKRGPNTIMVIQIDRIKIAHLGDLGHTLTTTQLEAIGSIDVLCTPVGGIFSLSPKQASEVIKSIEPSIVIPMHYRTDRHSPAFSQMSTLADFLKEVGQEEIKPQEKLNLTPVNLPEEMEVVVLENG